MARPNKLWYWKAQKTYCVTIDGKRHRLGKDKKAAQDEFYRLMLQSAPALSDSIAVILDDFLTWTLENREERTYKGYKDYCQSFVKEYPRLRVGELMPTHVTKWLANKKTWNGTTKRNAITAIQRGLNWAVKNRGLVSNPIKGMEKPEAKPRLQIISLDEFKEILKNTPDRNFRNLLRFCWECGCRPQEAKNLEAKHIEFEKHRFIYETKDSKGKKSARVVYLTEKAEVILRRILNPEGKLFLNTLGNPWTGYAVKCRFARLEEKIGKRYTQYAFRHTWVTRKLKGGVDSHIVATLAGHKDTNMIHKVYSAVSDDHEFLTEQARINPDVLIAQGQGIPVSSSRKTGKRKGKAQGHQAKS
ncbi:Tyrosine recombinase XerC [Gimesia alba]|uniref:Tyrosine recombinase XerC n=1 Tax=Gimesia alba TaxID=2527973 RepID=A0A517RFB4_9PLAN|nr:site-specific integrase [Gimesia alba]QDT42567.1 Tyrosine recombinase XerC [Gimesia alba]